MKSHIPLTKQSLYKNKARPFFLKSTILIFFKNMILAIALVLSQVLFTLAQNATITEVYLLCVLCVFLNISLGEKIYC